jgi:hypothetical protein
MGCDRALQLGGEEVQTAASGIRVRVEEGGEAERGGGVSEVVG